ncbi:MAG: hypothetical protein JWM33_3362 [Caulobacteraceae bacterium]|nr:hypothetical protein [Caulobacteraceae bacterium]
MDTVVLQDRAPAPDGRGRAGGRARLALGAGFLAYAAAALAGWWLLLRIVPSEVHVTLFGRSVGTNSAHEHINNLCLIFLLLPVALWIEGLTVGWSQSSARQLLCSPSPSLKTDIACFLLGQAHLTDIAGRVLTLGAALISGGWIRDQLQHATGLSIAVLPAPLPVQVVVYFFVYSFFDYWTHRFDHTRFLWPLHRYHHSAQDFGVITSGRQHPAAFTGIFLVNLPIAILGAPTAVMIYVNVLVVGIGFLLHSKIDSDWGWFGRWVIQSPNNHRMHHKLDMTHPTGHFAVAPVWDRLFGTYRQEGRGDLVIGVDTEYRHGFLAPRDMARDYAHFWIGLLGGRNDGPGAVRLFKKREPKT